MLALDLSSDPGPATLAEAGAGLSPGEGCGDQDLFAPLEALPPQAFSLSDEVRLRPARSLTAAFLAGLALGVLARRGFHVARPPGSSA
ncbi:MAG: hypothetical protein ACKOD3_04380 [Phenylobacterium sp.]